MAETIKTLRGFFWVNQVNCKSLRCIRNRSFALQLSIVKVGNGATEWNESATISPQTDDMETFLLTPLIRTTTTQSCQLSLSPRISNRNRFIYTYIYILYLWILAKVLGAKPAGGTLLANKTQFAIKLFHSLHNYNSYRRA